MTVRLTMAATIVGELGPPRRAAEEGRRVISPA